MGTNNEATARSRCAPVEKGDARSVLAAVDVALHDARVGADHRQEAEARPREGEL